MWRSSLQNQYSDNAKPAITACISSLVDSGPLKGSESSRRRPVAGGPVRSPFFCSDLLHDIDLEIPVSNDLLEPGVLLFELPQNLEVCSLQRAKALAPGIDALLADPVLLSDLGDRTTVGLAQDGDDLGFGETTLSHDFLSRRKPSSQVSAGPKIARQVTTSWLRP